MAQHEHDHEADETYGLALGFRIFEQDGKLFLAEAEVAPYVDAPDDLGVTLVFHPLDGINPVELVDEVDWPSWPVDIDDALTRRENDPMDVQFSAIVRQLHEFPVEQLREYLAEARENAESQS